MGTVTITAIAWYTLLYNAMIWGRYMEVELNE
jgi:hypothetical protein